MDMENMIQPLKIRHFLPRGVREGRRDMRNKEKAENEIQQHNAGVNEERKAEIRA